MIEHVAGNLFDAPVEALVNTVNCVGVMGKGIALQFRQAIPDSYEHYRAACARGEVQPGRVLVFERGGLIEAGPRYVIHFPTKRDWRSRSRLSDIEAGLGALVAEVQARGIRSIAIPPLGAGNGGLRWSDVRPRIEAAFATLPNVRVLLYEPGGAPAADALTVRTTRPALTRGRATLIRLVEAYSVLDYPLTAIEVQKLGYFGSEAGLLSKLRYVRHQFGPYAEALNHVLREMEGHYVRGSGDRATVRTELRLVPGAAEEATAFMHAQPDAAVVQQRLQQVSALIEGYETPYGMELLATVHFLFREQPETRTSFEATLAGVQAWNERKRRLMQPAHVRIAWEHLRACGWTPLPVLA